MKTLSASRLLLSALAALCLPAVLPAATTEKPADAAGTAKPYVLFMGTDLAVQREKKFHRVTDVVGSEFKIRVGQREFFVPTRSKGTDIKVNNSLKLSSGVARLDEVQSGPAYTTANDPARKAMAASGSAGGAAALQDLAQGELVLVSAATEHAANLAAAYPQSSQAQENAANFRIHLADAQRKEANLGHMARYDSQNSAGAHVDRMQGELTDRAGDH